MAEQRPPRLTPTFINNLEEPGRYGDGPGAHGLSLIVRRTRDGRLVKSWRQRIRVAGRYTNVGIGRYPDVSLSMAREQAFKNVRIVAEGKDMRTAPAKTPTVDEVADRMRAARFPEGENGEEEKAWVRLHSYCAAIGSKPVSEVTADDVISVIKPIWHEKTRTAHEVRAHLSRIMRRAIRDGYRTDDPAEAEITRDPGKPEPAKHHRSLNHRDG